MIFAMPLIHSKPITLVDHGVTLQDDCLNRLCDMHPSIHEACQRFTYRLLGTGKRLED